ncbi:helix-turn-helix domain-containing protein [Streptomyces sp. NPDC008343]|uniref:helix-turn-helix domain-containing protein n=1 Tax=Streptomyces sp. NPDC008343 TaxID=3364828 RepID=UPI0036EEC49B
MRTAERLAVHRNTLLHRLTKIEVLSGRGVREARTAMAMYLARLADALQATGRRRSMTDSARLLPTRR